MLRVKQRALQVESIVFSKRGRKGFALSCTWIPSQRKQILSFKSSHIKRRQIQPCGFLRRLIHPPQRLACWVRNSADDILKYLSYFSKKKKKKKKNMDSFVVCWITPEVVVKVKMSVKAHRKYSSSQCTNVLRVSLGCIVVWNCVRSGTPLQQ